MTILHFKSSVDYNLYINGEYVDYCKSRNSLDVIVNARSLTYMFCPISDGDTYITLNGVLQIINGNVVSESKNVSIVPFGENHYEIYFLTKNIDVVSKYNIVSEETVLNSKIKIYNNGKGIIDINNHEIDTDVIKMANVTSQKNCIIVECVTVNGRHAVLYDVDTQNIIIDTACNKVEILDGEVKVLKDLKDMLGQGVVISYNTNTKIIDRYVVYLTKTKRVEATSVIPYAFFSALSAKNYNLAKSYLSDAFAGIDDVQMDNYFGAFSQIYYNPYILGDRINYVLGIDNSYRSFDFVIKDGLIEDINEVK